MNFYVTGRTLSADLPTTPDTFQRVPGSVTLWTGDGTQSWRPSNGLGGAAVSCLALDGTGTVIAGTNLGVFRSTDHGASWTAANGGLDDPRVTRLVAGRRQNHLYAATNQAIYRTEDGGKHWRRLPRLPQDPASALAAGPGRTPTLLYVGNGSGIYRTTDDGKTWTGPGTGLTDANVLSLVVDPKTPTTVLGGTTSGAFRNADEGTTWEAFGQGRSRRHTWSPSESALNRCPRNCAFS